MIRTMSVLLAVALGALTSAPAFADAEEVARRCIARLDGIADRTTAAIDQTKDVGVARLVRLDDDGAPDRALIGSATRSKSAIQSTSDQARRKIGQIASDCVDALQDMDAPAPLIRAVRTAARASAGRVHNATERATDAMNRALRRVLNN